MPNETLSLSEGLTRWLIGEQIEMPNPLNIYTVNISVHILKHTISYCINETDRFHSSWLSLSRVWWTTLTKLLFHLLKAISQSGNQAAIKRHRHTGHPSAKLKGSRSTCHSSETKYFKMLKYVKMIANTFLNFGTKFPVSERLKLSLRLK